MSEHRYAIKEVFNTLQGEGGRSGCRSVFVRFAGCNLWNGTPLGRQQSTAPCAKWCDTDFAKGAIKTDFALLDLMNAQWPERTQERWCVLTGGEPSLQLDEHLVHFLHSNGWKIAVETNGTNDSPALRLVDWLCVSPKHGVPIAIKRANELKVVLPGIAPSQAGEGWTDAELDELERSGTWFNLFIQPQDILLSDEVGKTALVHNEDEVDEETAALSSVTLTSHFHRAVEFVMRHPHWRLSPQMHKMLGLP